MKKILLLLLVLTVFTSCQKTYEYVEFRDNGDIAKEEIKSDNDSIAYFQAFTKFEISKYVTKDTAIILNKEPSYTATSFQILFKNKPIIAKFKDQENNEAEIITRLKKLHENSEREPIVKIDSIKINALSPEFNFKKDEFSNNNLTWVGHKSNPKYRNRNSVHTYFASTNNKANNLRLVIQYTADNWLFFETAKFSIDDTAYSYTPLETKRDNDGGIIWEWSDEAVVSLNDITLIEALASANKAKIRLEGTNYHQVINLTQKQLNAIKETLEFYIASGGKLK